MSPARLIALVFTKKPRLAWAAIRRLRALHRNSKWKRTRVVPLLVGPDGPACDAQQAGDIMLEHFAVPEQAQIVTPDAYVSKYCSALDIVSHGQSHIHVSNVQTFPALVQSYAKARPNKAADIHGVRAELLRMAPVAAATLIHPLITSVCISAREPMSFKGGVAFPLSKGDKGEASHKPGGYREIMLAAVIGKHYYAFLRSRLLELGQCLFLACQTGGVPGRSTDISALMIRAHIARFRKVQKSGFILFVDIKQAFYSVLRQFIIPLNDPENLALADLEKTVPECLQESLKAIMHSPTEIENI
eukprot:5165948-Karenia_brevis.AAC.1